MSGFDHFFIYFYCTTNQESTFYKVNRCQQHFYKHARKTCVIENVDLEKKNVFVERFCVIKLPCKMNPFGPLLLIGTAAIRGRPQHMSPVCFLCPSRISPLQLKSLLLVSEQPEQMWPILRRHRIYNWHNAIANVLAEQLSKIAICSVCIL